MATFEEEDLSHYGVKGMKWGVRKDGSISSNTAKMSKLRRKETDVVVKQKPGQFVKTSGGKRRTASDDAVKVAATRQSARRSTTDSLTTKQLQEAVSRMELEKKYHNLSKELDRRNRGRKLWDKARGVKMKDVDRKINSWNKTVYSNTGKSIPTLIRMARKAATGV